MKRTKKEAEKTRQLLLDAATEVFNSRGYKAANLDDIAQVAHVTRGAIAWHFKNKENLFRTMLQESSNEAIQSTLTNFEANSSPIEKIEAYTDYIITERFTKQTQMGVVNKLITENPEGFEEVIKKIKDASNFIIEELKNAIEEGMKTGVFKRSINPDFTAKAIYTFTWGFFTDYSIFFRNYSEEQLRTLISDYFFEMLSV